MANTTNFQGKSLVARALLPALLFAASALQAQEPDCLSNQVIALKHPFITSSASQSAAMERAADSAGFEVKELSDTVTVLKLEDSFSKENASVPLVTYSEALELCDRADPALSKAGMFCEPDCRVNMSGTVPNDIYYSNSTLKSAPYRGDQAGYLGVADAESAWAINTGANCSGTVVAVIDTGVDYTHPDLAANIWSNSDEIPVNGIDDDGNGYIDDVRGYDFLNADNDPYDDNGHGTHVAGTIAAAGNNYMGVAGMAWGAKIMPLKFLDPAGSGYVSDAVQAINYAVANGARILNNSWGGPGYSLALDQAVQNAVNSGTLFVAAAGNSADDNDASSSYPANFSGVISVAAAGKDGKLAGFSNYGAHTVHLAAPGVDILSTWPGSTYAWSSGTSMATPHVSGAAALAWCHKPGLAISDIKAYLLGTVTVSSDLAGKVSTNGRLNMAGLLKAADSGQPVSPQPAPSSDPYVRAYDSASGQSTIQPGRGIRIEFNPGAAADVLVRFKIGRFQCRQKIVQSNASSATAYIYSGLLSSNTIFNSMKLELLDTQSGKRISSFDSPVSLSPLSQRSQLRKKSRRGGKKSGIMRTFAQAACRDTVRSLVQD